MDRPRSTYALALTAPAAQLAIWATEAWVSESSAWAAWVATWPMVTIWFGALAFAGGLLIQDLFNADSWLFRARRAWNRLFKLDTVNVVYWQDVLGPLQLSAQIKATRRIPAGELVVSALMRDNSALGEPSVFHKQTKLHLAEGEALRIALATIPVDNRIGGEGVQPPPMHLGTDASHGVIPTNAEVWFEIEILSGARKQSFLIYFRSPFSQNAFAIHTYVLQREDVNPFDGIRFKFPSPV